MNIVALDARQLSDLDWSDMEKLGAVTRYDVTNEDQIIDRAADADIVLVNKVRLTGETLDALPKLKYIGELATGYDNIDAAAAAQRGITVSNVPGYSTDSVAQLTFALLLELCHHVGEHSRSVTKDMKWSSQSFYCFWDYPLLELAGRTMGIFGLGRIGTKVAEIARAFGMNVIAYTRTPKEVDHITLVDFDTLLRTSDVISLNCPLNEQTKGVINAETLGKMKRSAFLINTSRGGTIVESDLRRALDDGVIAGAAVDVTGTEPPAADNPLIGAKNIIVTPHIAWATQEARKRLLATVIGNIAAYLDGKPRNTVR